MVFAKKVKNLDLGLVQAPDQITVLAVVMMMVIVAKVATIMTIVKNQLTTQHQSRLNKNQNQVTPAALPNQSLCHNENPNLTPVQVVEEGILQ
jgi:hypothetical protein